MSARCNTHTHTAIASDCQYSTSNNQGYELTFAGKGLARALANKEATKELQVDRKRSKNFDTTENVVIEGDNLEALKILYQNYYSKIKMIYIDPPYNTKSDEFIYNDNFKKNEKQLIEEFGLQEDTQNFLHNIYGTKTHSGWLSFMYPRLKVARDLLKDDGVIFISIDDNEQAQLKLMCDEIFGEENFVANLVWEKLHTTKNDAKNFSCNVESCFVYVKNLNDRNLIKNLDYDKTNDYKHDDNDGKGLYKLDPLTAKSGNTSKEYTFKNGIKYAPNSGTYWRYSFENLQNFEKDNKIYFNKNNKPMFKRHLQDVSEGKKVSTLLLGKEFGFNLNGDSEFKKLFDDKKIFTNPKPSKLLTKLIKISTQSNDIILDFFAGSGTTGDAVMQLNAEDGGNRKYILVQLDEDIKQNTEAHKFCVENKLNPVISNICIERLNRAGNKIKKGNPLASLDIGYKVFSLTDKQRIIHENNKLKLHHTRTLENTLYTMLCVTGKLLHTKVETLIKDKLYKCDNEIYLLSTINKEELKEKVPNYKDIKINIDGYVDIALETFLNLDVKQDNITIVY